MAAPTKKVHDVRVEVIDNEDALTAFFACACATFGKQTNDGLWTIMNPGWDTPEGKKIGAAKLVKRWKAIPNDKFGNPNTVFLAATVPPSDSSSPSKATYTTKEGREYAGFAIWEQASFVEGRGNPPQADFANVVNFQEMFPGDEKQQRFTRQAMNSLVRQRVALAREKADTDSPAIFVLDMCITDPAHQRKGAASRLVEWGVAEAKRRGGLECTTEGSTMGREVYKKFGFAQEGPEIEYFIDEEFRGRNLPSNIFMRTGK